MMSQPGKQKIAMHTLPNISRSKGNQTMKYGKSCGSVNTEYNMKSIFLEKSYTKCGEETIASSFSKNQN